jgi:hypothetical protein
VTVQEEAMVVMETVLLVEVSFHQQCRFIGYTYVYGL